MESTVKEVIEILMEHSDPARAVYKAKKFGITANEAIGIYNTDLRKIAAAIGKSTALALALWEQPIYEAKLLAGYLIAPKEVGLTRAQNLVVHFNNWEICDLFSQHVFSKSPDCTGIVESFIPNEKLYIRWSGLATLVGILIHDKKSENNYFIPYLKASLYACSDERDHIKKALSWVWRTAAKRNVDLLRLTVATWEQKLKDENKASRWVARDIFKEIESPRFKMMDYPRKTYRQS